MSCISAIVIILMGIAYFINVRRVRSLLTDIQVVAQDGINTDGAHHKDECLIIIHKLANGPISD